ncbi:MAG: SPOR domain-containing protein [Burkholderiaceae bacterium]
MRIALLLLIVANLLAFAWGQDWLDPIIGDVRQPERMSRQVGPERLRVLGPDDRAGTERAVAGRVESEERADAGARVAAGAVPAPSASAAQSAGSGPTVPGGVASRPLGDGDGDGTGDGDGMGDASAEPGDNDRDGGNADDPPALQPSVMIPDASDPADAGAQAGASADAAAPPALSFGLAEPPLTAALADDADRGASATGAAESPAAPTGPGVQSPAGVETGLWPAPLASAAAPPPPACFDLGDLDRVQAEAARTQLQGMGATSIEELRVDNRSGYIVYLPAFESAGQAQARIDELRERGVRDIYLIRDGSYRHAVSLGVFNRMDSVELLLDALRAQGVEDAEVGFVNPAATRITLRVQGPPDMLDEARMGDLASLRGARLARCP